MCENASNIINFTVARHKTEDRYLIQKSLLLIHNNATTIATVNFTVLSKFYCFKVKQTFLCENARGTVCDFSMIHLAMMRCENEQQKKHRKISSSFRIRYSLKISIIDAGTCFAGITTCKILRRFCHHWCNFLSQNSVRIDVIECAYFFLFITDEDRTY